MFNFVTQFVKKIDKMNKMKKMNHFVPHQYSVRLFYTTMAWFQNKVTAIKYENLALIQNILKSKRTKCF